MPLTTPGTSPSLSALSFTTPPVDEIQKWVQKNPNPTSYFCPKYLQLCRLSNAEEQLHESKQIFLCPEAQLVPAQLIPQSRQLRETPCNREKANCDARAHSWVRWGSLCLSEAGFICKIAGSFCPFVSTSQFGPWSSTAPLTPFPAHTCPWSMDKDKEHSLGLWIPEDTWWGAGLCSTRVLSKALTVKYFAVFNVCISIPVR